MRPVLLFLLCMTLTACGLSLPLGAEREAAALYDQALQDLSGGGTGRLQALREAYPQSRWAWRAETLIQALAEEDARSLALSQRLKNADRQLAACRQESSDCTAERDRLRQDLEELKRLVIETELRTRSAPAK